MKRRKLDSLVFLRAIAVIAVCFCHFGHPFESKSILGVFFTFFHDYGKYGVQIFFVVSGFVIPLSLLASNYTIDEYFKFLWKRLLRLHPPYLAALGLTIVIAYFSCLVRRIPYDETITSVLQSLFYFHVPSENPVFWTLAVEAQYYIFIGVTYGFISNSPKTALAVFIPLSILVSQLQIAQYVVFFSFIVYFLIGIIGFLIYSQKGSLFLNITGIIILLGYSGMYDEISASISALFAIVFILWYQGSIPSSIAFIGEISYSLYLIHFPVGIKFINLINRYINPSLNWMLFILAMALVVTLSWGFYNFIEKPSAKLSSKLKFKTKLVPVSILAD